MSEETVPSTFPPILALEPTDYVLAEQDLSFLLRLAFARGRCVASIDDLLEKAKELSKAKGLFK